MSKIWIVGIILIVLGFIGIFAPYFPFDIEHMKPFFEDIISFRFGFFALIGTIGAFFCYYGIENQIS